jgi:hypothetical protein
VTRRRRRRRRRRNAFSSERPNFRRVRQLL